jgi:hypothetical protein
MFYIIQLFASKKKCGEINSSVPCREELVSLSNVFRHLSFALILRAYCSNIYEFNSNCRACCRVPCMMES